MWAKKRGYKTEVRDRDREEAKEKRRMMALFIIVAAVSLGVFAYFLTDAIINGFEFSSLSMLPAAAYAFMVIKHAVQFYREYVRNGKKKEEPAGAASENAVEKRNEEPDGAEKDQPR